MVKVCKFISNIFFSISIKENEFYNIKTRLHLELFSVKTLLLSSFALAAMTFPNVGYVIMTVRFLKLYELWRTVEREFYNIKSRLYLGHFSEKTLFLPSFALDATLQTSLGLLHGRKRAHCATV